MLYVTVRGLAAGEGGEEAGVVEFHMQVQKLLDLGWKPQGGVSITFLPEKEAIGGVGGVLLAQAMIFKE